jgi:mono/diheme cytochrome c family protein
MILGVLGLALSAGALAERSLEDGVFSKAQAKTGKKLFGQHCKNCHHPKKYFDGKLKEWEGLTLDQPYGIISGLMPQDNPGGLWGEEYAAILAYILEENDFPAGAEALDSGALADIRVIAP